MYHRTIFEQILLEEQPLKSKTGLLYQERPVGA